MLFGGYLNGGAVQVPSGLREPPTPMLIISILIVILIFNLFDVLSEKSTIFYKDIRFWLVLISMGVLAWLTVASYPA